MPVVLIYGTRRTNRKIDAFKALTFPEVSIHESLDLREVLLLALTWVIQDFRRRQP